jgi:hypothetical protein
MLAEFMVTWRWQNMLANKFLKWSLRMLLVMLNINAAVGNRHISVRMLNGREREKVQRNSRVAPGLK